MRAARLRATSMGPPVGQYKLDWTVTDVQPTFSAHVAFVFDVARDALGLTLLNVPSFGGTTQKLFSLGI